MKCSEVSSLSPLLLSGELDSSRFAELQRHLQSCAACAREIAAQRECDAVLREAVLAEPEDVSALTQRVRDQIQIAPPVRRLRFAAAIAAGIAAVFAITFFSYQAFRPAAVPQLYQIAARDHHREVIDQQPRNWVSRPSDIDKLAARLNLPAELASRIAPSGQSLRYAKLCHLDDRIFLHLVYAGRGSDVSVYLQQPGTAPFPLRRAQLVSGQPCWGVDMDREHMVVVQTESFLALVVSSESGDQAWDAVRHGVATL